VSALQSRLRRGHSVRLVRGAHATYDDEMPAEATSQAVEAELRAAGIEVVDPEQLRF
jgi:hypothetical protein